MGAALAIEALARHRVKAKGFVLWDPVVSGSEYLSTLEKMHAELVLQRKEPLQLTDELLGARFPMDLRAAIHGLNVANRIEGLDLKKAALIVSEDLPRYSTLLNTLRSKWPEVVYRSMAEPVRWDNLKAAYEARITGPIVRAVADAAESMA